MSCNVESRGAQPLSAGRQERTWNNIQQRFEYPIQP